MQSINCNRNLITHYFFRQCPEALTYIRDKLQDHQVEYMQEMDTFVWDTEQWNERLRNTSSALLATHYLSGGGGDGGGRDLSELHDQRCADNNEVIDQRIVEAHSKALALMLPFKPKRPLRHCFLSEEEFEECFEVCIDTVCLSRLINHVVPSTCIACYLSCHRL